MMENRSFDHYLGWLPGADGRQDGLTYADAEGRQHHTHRLQGDFQGCAHPDPDHSWVGGRQQLDGGRMDGFLRSGSNDSFSIGYYAEEDLPFIPRARPRVHGLRPLLLLAARLDLPEPRVHACRPVLRDDGQLASASARGKLGFPDTTIFAALAAKGVSSRYFYTDIPVSALWGAPGIARSSQVQEYYERCASGTLPALSFVDPAFNGEEQGTSGDEHPHGDVRFGQAFIADVVHAFLEAPSSSAARCSSSTTSGAASSTTSGRRACPTCARAPTSNRTSARWGSGSRR